MGYVILNKSQIQNLAHVPTECLLVGNVHFTGIQDGSQDGFSMSQDYFKSGVKGEV